MIARAPALLLATTAACAGPAWTVRSPDRAHSVRVLPLVGGEVRVGVDGAIGDRYVSVALEAMRFSPDGLHHTFPAQKQVRGPWIIVADGYESAPFDGIGELLYSPDSRRLAAAVRIGAAWHVLLGRDRGPPFEAIYAGSMTFSPDSRRLAYAALAADGAHAVVDGTPGPAYAAIAGLRFGGSAGTRVVHAARKGPRWVLVADGAEVAEHDLISEIALDPIAGKWAYAAKDGDRWIVRREDGAATGTSTTAAAPDAVEGLTFSATGARFAYVARRGDKQHMVVDGAEGGLHDAVRRPVFAPAGSRWGYVVRDGEKSQMVLDGKPLPAHAWVGDAVFSEDGASAAYLVRGANATTALVHDLGEPVRLGAALEGTLVLSANGDHWACASGDPMQRTMFIATDLGEPIPIDLRELGVRMFQATAGTGELTDIGALTTYLRELARGELDRALASPPRAQAQPERAPERRPR